MKKLRWFVALSGFIVALAITHVTWAASLLDYPNIAVLPYANKSAQIEELPLQDATIVSEFIIEQLIDTERFNIIEREVLADLMKEHSFNMSGVVDPTTVVPLGRLAGVQFLVAGSVTGLATKTSGVEYTHSEKGGAGFNKNAVVANITARIIDLETGRIVLAASGTGESARTYAEFSLKKQIEEDYETDDEDSDNPDVSEGTSVRTSTQTLTIGGKSFTRVQVRNALYKAVGDLIYNKNYGLLAKLDGKSKRRKV